MSLRFVAALSACVLAMGCSDSTDPGEGGLSQTGIDGGGDPPLHGRHEEMDE